VKQEAAPGLALHVSAPENVAEKLVGGLVDDFGRGRKLSRFEDADHDAGAALLFRASAFYAKFQNALLGNRWMIPETVWFRVISAGTLIIPQVFTKSQSRHPATR
jgi:hypothetical protein